MRDHLQFTCRLALTAALTVVAAANAARAAVGECQAEISGKPAIAATELEAKRTTLQDWLAQAKAIGPGYTRWEIAWSRRIECKRTPEGQFHCQAIARPCTIKQVPNPNLPILKRGA